MGRAKEKLSTGIVLSGLWLAGNSLPAWGLPDPQESPEEVLRREIILEGRSPLDGEPLNAQEYVLLQEELKTAAFAPPLNPRVQELIRLLRIRKILKTLLPF